MQAEGRPFQGCLYFGLMLTTNGPKVIEYNCRFGDPETQVVLPLLETDLVDIMQAISEQKLAELPVVWKDGCAACVVMASGGYPKKYATGLEISGLDDNGQIAGCTVYHAGTKLAEDGKQLLTAGGRVLGVTATAEDLPSALQKAYDGVATIQWDAVHYRHDIGQRALKALQ
jgi:phosphoribosylamine--glycine ligase